MAVGESARGLPVDRERFMAGVEHDKIIAEPVHLAKADPAHIAAYMAGSSGPVQQGRVFDKFRLAEDLARRSGTVRGIARAARDDTVPGGDPMTGGCPRI